MTTFIKSPVQFSDVTEDGTYLVDASGDLHRMEYASGYMVAEMSVLIYPLDSLHTEIPKLTVLGRWTDFEDGLIYWDEVELIDNLLNAGNIARARGELAIWDNLNNCEVRV